MTHCIKIVFIVHVLVLLKNWVVVGSLWALKAQEEQQENGANVKFAHRYVVDVKE